MDLKTTKIKLDRLRVQYEAAGLARQEIQSRYTDAVDAQSYAEEAQQILQHSAQAIQQKAHERISNVVSRCLASVFDEPYEFCVEFERKRGKTEAHLLFIRNGVILDDPLNQAGGGAVDVASFALRLACLVLRKPPLRRVLILDEPFKNIRGKSYRNRVRGLIEELSRELDVQFILNIDADAYPEFLLGEVVEVR